MLPSIFLLILLSLAASPSPAAARLGAGARAIYWFPDLSATARTVPGGTEFDLRSDLGVADENIPAGEAFVNLGKFTFRAGYAAAGYDGDRTVTDTIVFNGRTYGGGARVVTSLDLTTIDGEIQWDIVSPSVIAASVNVGLLIKVKYVDGSLELAEPVSGARDAQDLKLPIPMAGVAAGVGILKDYLRADARVAGMGYAGNRIVEADAFASVVPFPFFRIQGGYRYLGIKIDDDDVVGEITLKGPYAGLQLSF